MKPQIYRLVVVVTILLFLTGCSGINGQSTQRDVFTQTTTQEAVTKTQSPSDSEKISPDLIFSRMSSLLSLTSPPTVTTIPVQNASPPQGRLPVFVNFTGMESRQQVESPAYVTGIGNVVYEESLRNSGDEFQLILAHEYVHIVQRGNNQLETVTQINRQDPLLFDSRITTTAVSEGSAVFVTEAYRVQYVRDAQSRPEIRRGDYQNRTGIAKLSAGAYYFGYEYINNSIGTPSQLTSIYSSPPETTEEIIHQLPPGSEPVPSLNTTIEPGLWDQNPTNIQAGEMYIRSMLGSYLREEAAAQGSSGWGNDSAYTFTNGDQTSIVWVTKWDTESDAREFETTASEYLTMRGEQIDIGWNIDLDTDRTTASIYTPTNDTVILMFGPENTNRQTRIFTNGSGITIEYPE